MELMGFGKCFTEKNIVCFGSPGAGLWWEVFSWKFFESCQALEKAKLFSSLLKIVVYPFLVKTRRNMLEGEGLEEK